jgi:hypothetical protein
MESGTPGPAPDHSVVIPLSPSVAAPALVRTRCRELLAGCPADVVEDAVQVVDALITNASRQGRLPRQVRITPLPDQDRLHIEVDHDAHADPAIQLVHQLTFAWGLKQRGPHTTTLWADVGLNDDNS